MSKEYPNFNWITMLSLWRPHPFPYDVSSFADHLNKRHWYYWASEEREMGLMNKKNSWTLWFGWSDVSHQVTACDSLLSHFWIMVTLPLPEYFPQRKGWYIPAQLTKIPLLWDIPLPASLPRPPLPSMELQECALTAMIIIWSHLTSHHVMTIMWPCCLGCGSLNQGWTFDPRMYSKWMHQLYKRKVVGTVHSRD